MTTTLTILKNSSKMSSEQVNDFFEARAPGYHLGLAQNRYGDGVFMMDWRECGESKPEVTADWNILVHVS